MAPPIQVAAPPKGSISVGWLCVSFLKSNNQSSSLLLTSTFILTVQAFISSDSSSLSSLPAFFKNFAAIVAMSIRFTGFVLSSSRLVSRYLFQAFSTFSSSKLTLSMLVRNVVCLQ